MDVNNVISQRARTIFAKVLCAVSSAQCNMAFSAEKDVLSVERHVKTKSFKTMHRDCSRPFECPVRAKSVMQQSVKKFRETGKVLVNISKRVRRSNAVTATRMAVVSEGRCKTIHVIERTCTTDWNVQSCCHTTAKALCFQRKCILFNDSYHLTVQNIITLSGCLQRWRQSLGM